jgi:hypothetical protein
MMEGGAGGGRGERRQVDFSRFDTRDYILMRGKAKLAASHLRLHVQCPTMLEGGNGQR